MMAMKGEGRVFGEGREHRVGKPALTPAGARQWPREAVEAMLEAQVELSTRTSDDVGDVALRVLPKIMRAQHVVLFRYDERTQTLSLQKAVGFPAEMVERARPHLTFHRGEEGWAAGIVALTLRPLYLPDTWKDPRWTCTDLPARSVYLVPIVFGERLFGVVELMSPEPYAFSEAERSLVDLFVRHVGIALENARLLREMRRRLREVTLLSHVITVAALAEDLPSALQTLCAELARFLRVPQTAFVLLDENREAARVVAEHREPGRPSALGVVIPVEGNPFMAYILEHKAPLAVTEAQRDPRLASVRATVRSWNIASILIVPIATRGEVVGTIGLGSLEPREFTPDEITLVKHVASQAGQVLERLQLFQEM
ncbi:MAG: GAF domain-containing protein, partial [Anaerolineae bacterium]|nr:GAF domain-containing protein [Anaerolineae bacterium]